jgi:signal transduction histidine kinase
MPRGRRLALRWRLTAALTFVSGLTLLVATLVLLLPLDRRLRTDALDTLTQTALAARREFGEIPARRVRVDSPELQRAAASLRRRTQAEVIIADPTGQVLVATDVDDLDKRYPIATRALRERKAVRQVSGSGDGADAAAAVPVVGERMSYALIVRRPLRAIAGTAGVVARGFVVAAIIGMVLAVGTGLLLSRRMVRRLGMLRDTALNIGPDTPLEADPGADEIGDLSRAFAQMQQRLREQEQARRTFVATASHELRTPLASLQLMLGLLSEELEADAPDVADAREQAAAAQRQTDRLSQLASALLDLSRLDAGLPLRREVLALDDTCRAVIAEFGPRAEAAAAPIELTAPGHCWAAADPGAVAQIVRILLDNALRFSPSGSRVQVDVGAADGRATVSVADAGPGVAAEDRGRVFDRFERGRETAGDSGFGLGLAIGRELARRMDGDLLLADGSVDGSGARFVLTVPAAPPDELETA